MSDFTREDEITLDMLRTKGELGYLQTDEAKTLQQLEQRYEVFIKEGLRNLARMAPRRSIRHIWLQSALISWPMLCLLLSLFFVALYLLHSPQGSGGPQALLPWHLRLVAVLLAAATLVGFTRMRERPFLSRAVLVACMVSLMTLSVLMLLLLYRSHHTDDAQWDVRLCAIVGGLDGVIVLESALLLFARF
ncbi:Tcc1i14-2.5 [Trypanosoma grayi]|uniref:Tcc1i14-2.5 n=1 Tax=Trypanosoma grayi TaxID=71804 RepID=UPI0004F40C4F|nr:Tcc1i14-2.5 [Trypanosoma grayi]KEG11627.1 Tcc1i14-2.5 [Trypanosoma grayi]